MFIAHSPDKKSIDNVSVKNIFLDYQNPRITWITFSSEEDLLLYMYENFSLDELAISMTQFWYFDAEPVVCIPKNLPEKFKKLSKEVLATSDEYANFLHAPDTEFIVVEWNRRVSTLKILLNINWIKDNLKIRKEIFKKDLKESIKKDLEKIPVIVYSSRQDVIPYLWVRHIGWNKSRDPYAQAVYIDNLITREKYSIDDVTNLMADKASKIIKNFVALKLLDLADEMWLDTITAKNSFSFLILSIWQKPIKEYLWLPTNWNDINTQKIISDEKKDNFKRYFKWIYWDKKQGILPIISESRDITAKITKIFLNEVSTKYLEESNDINWAYDRSDWERDMVITWLTSAVTRIWNLKDLISFLLNKGILSRSDIENHIFYLKKHLNDLENTLKEYE